MKEQIPNYITMFRMAGTLGLLLTRPLSPAFYVIYMLCGLSDVLDGWMARRLHAASDLGARLDSMADLLFYAVMLLKLMPELWRLLPRQFWCAVTAVLLVRAAAYAVAAFRFHRFTSLHTIPNKVTGLLVFGLAYVLRLPFATGYCWVACIVALLSSAHELYLHLTSREYRAGRTRAADAK